jgi:hypothetical protein
VVDALLVVEAVPVDEGVPVVEVESSVLVLPEAEGVGVGLPEAEGVPEVEEASSVAKYCH